MPSTCEGAEVTIVPSDRRVEKVTPSGNLTRMRCGVAGRQAGGCARLNETAGWLFSWCERSQNVEPAGSLARPLRLGPNYVSENFERERKSLVRGSRVGRHSRRRLRPRPPSPPRRQGGHRQND